MSGHSTQTPTFMRVHWSGMHAMCRFMNPLPGTDSSEQRRRLWLAGAKSVRALDTERHASHPTPRPRGRARM